MRPSELLKGGKDSLQRFTLLCAERAVAKSGSHFETHLQLSRFAKRDAIGLALGTTRGAIAFTEIEPHRQQRAPQLIGKLCIASFDGSELRLEGGSELDDECLDLEHAPPRRLALAVSQGLAAGQPRRGASEASGLDAR